ncbi:MAG: septum formation protein [Saprospiraceae bacterium]|jgi:septum formation protein
MKFPKIILASKSPRRSQLLEQAGFDFKVKTTEVEEDYPADLAPQKVAEFLACKKARASFHFIENEEVILAADSIVLLDNIIYEKPKDHKDAVRILKALSGNVHEVITGVCLLSKNKERSFSGFSQVHFDDLTEEEIDYYIKTCQPFDKAGAYGVQEWIGLCKIRKIEGTYANIMGLPVDLVYKEMGRM